MVTFEDLNLSNPLLNAIADLGYMQPTPIQEKAFPVVMSGKDMVGLAQTGTGKTFAYLLPLLRQLKYSEQKHPRILIVVPTRELVVQVVEEIKKLTTYMNLRVAGIYGGTNINTQKKVVYAGLDILVATPGRLMDLYMTGLLRFKSIQKLVIDEVDEMLNQGFRPQLISLMEVLPERRQNLMFSATLTEDVEMLINDFFYEPKKVEITPHGTPLERIDQQAYHVPNYQTKVNLLELLLKENEDLSKVLVFVDNRKLADKLYDQIASKFPDQFGVIHSNKSQNLRLNSLKRFGDGTHRVLIATDIAARGLDISDVSHVINFDMPKAPGDYIHRIGRTGRADKDGVAITFINQIEQEYQMEIEQMMNKVMSLQESPGNLEISDKFEPSERPVLYDKDYLNVTRKTSSQGEAFHEKKDKNKKVNLGGPGRRKPKVGSKANRKRGRKK